MKLETYLSSKLSASSAKIYLFEIHHYIKRLGEVQAESAGYAEVLGYVESMRKCYTNAGTLHRILCAIKHYYNYLIEIEKRVDHPCRYMSIKDRPGRQIQIQDLLKADQLDLLLKRKERYEKLRLRNEVVMSLLVYQALRVKEMCNLKIEDVDLEKGKIQIRPTARTNERILSLKPNQILLFYKYVYEIRPELLRKKTDKLLITKKGGAERGEGIHYLVSTFKKQLPGKRLSATLIRQSVIAKLLSEGQDLRIVQVFAGHKTPGATERYRQSHLAALRESVDKYHPLG